MKRRDDIERLRAILARYDRAARGQRTAASSTPILSKSRVSEATLTGPGDPLGTTPGPSSPAATTPGSRIPDRLAPGSRTSVGTAETQDSPTARCWTVWSVDPRLRGAAVVKLDEGRIVGEREEIAPRGRLSSSALRRLGRFSRGSFWASAEPARVLVALRLALGPHGGAGRAGRRARAGAPDTADERAISEGRGDALLIQPLTRAILGPPRPPTLEAAARRLGVTIVGEEGPLSRARLAAECLVRLLDHPLLQRRVEDLNRTAPGRSPGARPREKVAVPLRLDYSALISLQEPGAAATPRARGRLGEENLASLPESPGIYRFLGSDGSLLYIGKARNLKRRVGSYFAPRSRPDPRTEPWLSRVERVEIETLGSEAEALIREADQIATARPVSNRQRIVHSRPHRSLGNLVLLLPGPRRGCVRAHLVHEGRLAGRVVLGSRGGGTGELRTRIETLWFGAPGPPARERPAARRARSVIASWLAAQPAPPPAFDPTDASGVETALALALRYAESVRRGERGIIHR